MILSVGAGKKSAAPGVIRLDISPEVEPDIIWDLNKFPYPVDESSMSAIECLDVIEHLDNIPRVMEEFYRILEPNGLLKLTTPHFSAANSYIDPTHRWHLSHFSFDYFCEGHNLSYYSKARYKKKVALIQFQGGRWSRSVVSRLANRFPETYEQRFAWMFPAWFLYFELETVK